MVCNFFARSENIQQEKNDAWRNYDKPSFWRHFVVCVMFLLLSVMEKWVSEPVQSEENLSPFFLGGH